MLHRLGRCFGVMRLHTPSSHSHNGVIRHLAPPLDMEMETYPVCLPRSRLDL